MLYDLITRIMERLETGTILSHQPWVDTHTGRSPVRFLDQHIIGTRRADAQLNHILVHWRRRLREVERL
jgi:hypothetical protein